jgi:NADH-quinone oxidoreductase subunit C
MPVLERITGDAAVERVQGALGELASEVKDNWGHVSVTCEPASLPEVVTKLRDAEGVRCRFFTFLSAIDWSEFGEEPNTEDPYEVLVHLYSPEYTIHVDVHVPLKGVEPSCPSITEVFSGALWHEREAHEMFGIDFDGHPGLVNLYLPEDFEGHPLRKTFKLATRGIKQWPGAKDPEEAAGGGR